MDPTRALELLQRQRDLAHAVPRSPRHGPDWNKWHRDTEIVLQNVFGGESRHLRDFTHVTFSKGWVGMRETPDLDAQAYERGFAEADAVLSSMQDEIRDFGLGAAVTSPQPDALQDIDCICGTFHRVARQLRARHAGRPTLDVQDEYDQQDLLHALLVQRFEDVRSEEWTPSYAGGSSRADFLLPAHHIVIETKLARRSLSSRQLGDELVIDIARYRAHPKCRTLVCFVYDPAGLLANPRGLENDLTRAEEDFSVVVVIHPN